MVLCEELYFEITLTGTKAALKKLVSFLRSGELDEFFPFESEYISYDDGYDEATLSTETSITLSNDDCGIEIDEFDTDEFLDVFCRAAAELDVVGSIYDINDDEFSFISESGDSYYVNARKTSRFNEDDDLDEVE
ncbi:MAG: hypothetical protein IJW03_03620 [Clostridia bacterium]|nr:hypothetical protein [Clostridia bacterium]